jgi:hypothetical protein
MKKIYTIKKDHPVLEVIRQEILKSPGFTKDVIGIGSPSIDDKALCGSDIYGFHFNANNWDVLTLNIGVFFNPKSEDAPKILSEHNKGYDHYTTSSNVSIKLKTFLERNPEFKNIEEWAEKVVYKKGKFKYNGHNSNERRFSVSGIGDLKYDISFPENVPNDKGILEWSKPACEALTKSYWREVRLDETFNIKRGRSVWVEGTWFTYDYKDGLIEVYDARIHSNSIWSCVKLFDPKKETLDKIKFEIEGGDILVNEVKFINKKEKQKRFKYEDLVGI